LLHVVTAYKVAVNPQTKPTDLGCSEYADNYWLLSSTFIIAIDYSYYYWAKKLKYVIICRSHVCIG